VRDCGVSGCQKTFRRCRRGRSPSDFSSCKPALPADGWLFERKAKSLRDRCFSLRKNSALLGRWFCLQNQFLTNSGDLWLTEFASSKSGFNHFFDTLEPRNL